MEAVSDRSIVDLTDILPDGSLQSLELVLSRLEEVVAAKLYVSLGSSLDSLLTVSPNHRDLAQESNQETSIRAALREACSEGRVCRFATNKGNSSLILKQLHSDQNASLVVSFNLCLERKPESDLAYAAVLMIVPQREDSIDTTSCVQWIEMIRNSVQAWIGIWWLCYCGRRWQKSRKNWLAIWSQRRWAYTLSVLVALVCLWVPVPYWPQRKCILEPAKTSFVASPLDGVIEEISVKPGDEVKQGETLARLEDEQLRWQLSTAQAEYETAAKRRDTALAARTAGDLRMAQLEQDKQKVIITSIQKQLQNLELCSPVTGVIVQGDVIESKGLPVARGATLFEVAPLDRMRVEIHLTTRDLANIEIGQSVTLRVDTDRSQTWTAKIIRIAPRAKVIDSQVVFVAVAEIDNPSGILRPGMNGSVCITAGSKSLGWLLFSKPYDWVLGKLYW